MMTLQDVEDPKRDRRAGETRVVDEPAVVAEGELGLSVPPPW